MSAPRLPLPTRVAAWVYTGPLGHLYGGVADWVELLAKLGWARVDPRRRAIARRHGGTSPD